MKIKKVQLKGSGFGGCYVTYLKQEEKKGRLFNVEVTEKKKNPIHLGLENKFKELRPFLLTLCKVLHGNEDKMIKDQLILESEITAIQIVIDTTTENNEGTGFILEGTSVVLAGNKEVKHKTPKIEVADGYADFEAVQLIIKELLSEVMVYLSGSAVISDEEALIRWYERKNGADSKKIEEVKKMSPDEQKATLTKILEGLGCVVIAPEDIAINEVEEEEITEEIFTIEPEKEVVMIKR